ncbi:MAG: T9SS type B sorting domain-containing protein, partial [Flavobacteriaceae bacterium]
DDLFICDDNDDGVISFTFQESGDDIINGQDTAVYSISYHLSLADAETNANAINLPYQNTNSTEEIFVRIENNNNSNCFDTTSFNITVFDTPTANAVQTVEECDNLDDGNNANGQRELNLNNFDNAILGAQDNTLFSVSYHLTQDDANNNDNPIISPYYNTTPFSYQIFARIENNLKTDCYDTTVFTVNINPIPVAFDTTLIQCDEDGINDGFTIFNLDEANSAVTNGFSGLSTKFFLQESDAQNSTGEINAAPFTNTVNPQIIYVQVINDNTGCFDISQISLEVSLTSGNDSSLTSCDDDGIEDGFKSFTLSDATPSILAGLPSDYNLAYYETYENALLEQNPLPNTFTNTIAYNQIIYARIENNNQCYGINELELTVFKLPQLEQGDQTFFCVDSNSDPVILNSGIIGNPLDYSYVWSSGETTEDIEINQGGTYTVTATNANNCSQSKSITVVNSNIATIETIAINDVSSNNTISIVATGEGDYEYALDNSNGPYQDDTTFYDVSPGFHTVYVRDKNGCGIANETVSVIGFPNFFTPNGDGYNDTWHIYGINTPSQSESEIYIFDRYGKLLKQLLYNSLGWDGTYNGNPMPTSDYWFYIKLGDNRIFRGHFTLKR